MSDIKLFKLDGARVHELDGQSVAVERSLQQLIERHLEALLGVRFLASEHSTGKVHAGRIDTLGIDEDGCPVIVEYKRASNQNVVNQGLFYLDWLLDHKGEFELLVLNRLGKEASGGIEWPSPRLLCIAGDFTRYDQHAVMQINRNIELIRYKRYGEDLLMLELVNTTPASNETMSEPTEAVPPTRAAREVSGSYVDRLPPVGDKVRDLYEAVRSFLEGLGGDVQMKSLKFYIAFRRLKNFASLVVSQREGYVCVWVKVDPDSITLDPKLMRDVRRIGHHGTGDLEITIKSVEDLEKAKPFLIKSYEAS